MKRFMTMVLMLSVALMFGTLSAQDAKKPAELKKEQKAQMVELEKKNKDAKAELDKKQKEEKTALETEYKTKKDEMKKAQSEALKAETDKVS